MNRILIVPTIDKENDLFVQVFIDNTDEEFSKMPKGRGLNYIKIEESKQERVEIPMNKKDL